MPKRTFDLLLIVCLMLSLLAFIVWYQKPSMTVEHLDFLIRQEIPIGSPRSQVVSFFDSHSIKHTDYYGQRGVDFDFHDERLESRKDSVKGLTTASIRDIKWSFFTSKGITMQFYFDDKNNLIDYRIKEYVTSF